MEVELEVKVGSWRWGGVIGSLSRQERRLRLKEYE